MSKNKHTVHTHMFRVRSEKCVQVAVHVQSYTSGGGGRRGGDAGGVWGVNFGPKAAVDLWRQERQKAPSTDGIPPGH